MPIPTDAPRRDTASPHLFDNLCQDVRFGVRSAMRAPLFFVLALFTLAVGIGANAAVFGVVKSVLLDRLPYTDAGRLVRVFAHPANDPSDRQGISSALVMDIAERQRSFSSLAAFYHTTIQNTYLGESGPRIMKGAVVGPGFFQTLGVQPAVGRALGEADAETGAPPVAMLSYDVWQREFGGDARVVGKSLLLDGDATEVVGVLPRGFVGPMGEADVWYPLDLGPSLRACHEINRADCA